MPEQHSPLSTKTTIVVVVRHIGMGKYEAILQMTAAGHTFEDVTILQLLSIRTLSKTLL
jgi:hypothetical protein